MDVMGACFAICMAGGMGAGAGAMPGCLGIALVVASMGGAAADPTPLHWRLLGRPQSPPAIVIVMNMPLFACRSMWLGGGVEGSDEGGAHKRAA